MILLTGVTGKTGGEVARQLSAGGQPFRAIVRDPAKAAELRYPDAEIVVGDVADRAFLSQAMKGIDKALLVLPNVEAQFRMEAQFADVAVENGVGHLVYLSSLESVPESPNPITRNHVAAEHHIRRSGIEWTMIRPTFFMQILSGMGPRIRASGQITLPAGNGTVATTDIRDVGAVIVRAFADPAHRNQSYDLTGPELLTFTQIAERCSRALGCAIEYVDQPMEEFRKVLPSAGLDPWRVDAVCKEFEAIAAGAIDHTTDTIERLLGRPACSLDRFLADHLDAFR